MIYYNIMCNIQIHICKRIVVYFERVSVNDIKQEPHKLNFISSIVTWLSMNMSKICPMFQTLIFVPMIFFKY